MTIFQLCFSPLCFVIATVMVRRILNGRYTLWKGILWSLLWCLGGLLILLPELTTWAAQLLGIGRGTDLVLYLGTLAGIYLFQRLYGRTRRMENMLTEMVRRQTILTPNFGPHSSATARRASPF